MPTFTIGSRLKESREKKGLLQSELAKMIGVKSAGVISNWEKDINKPNADKMVELCQVLGISLSYLLDYYGEEKAPLHSSEAEQLARDYDSLDVHGRKAVRAVADVEIARCAELAQTAPAREPDETVYYITSWFYRPMSAGTGEQAGDEQPENLRLVKEPPRGTSYVAPISGDSMEPTYHYGDKLFIRACEEIEPGQIGVFFMDGQQWVKELGDGVLISHNPSYPPRPMTEDIRCQGLEMGVCDEIYFE